MRALGGFGLALGLSFLGVNGLGGVFRSRSVTSSSRDNLGDFGMPEFTSLDPMMRAHALVGFFLQAWALLETEINDAMAKALELDDTQSYIVSRNVQFTAKTHIIRSALPYTKIAAADQERYDSVLNDIQSYSHVRNMMAHDVFGPSQTSDGVKFLVVKAKGSLKFPAEDWPIQRFVEEASKIRNWGIIVGELEAALNPVKNHLSLLAQALRDYERVPHHEPNAGLFSLGGISLGPRLPPETPEPTPTQTTEEIDVENPLVDEEKDGQ
jgi:hypothetical protein